MNSWSDGLYNEANDNNKQESSSSDTQTTTSNSSNKSLTQFEEFLETNNHDWGAFLDSYYSITPATEQNTAFTKYISGKTYTFEGTVIESMTTRIAIIADKEYDDKSWNDISATPKVGYKPFVLFKIAFPIKILSILSTIIYVIYKYKKNKNNRNIKITKD